MSSTDEPYVPPTPIAKPSASIEVVKETYDGPSASIESIKASENTVANPAPKPAGPPPSVDTEKKGIDPSTVVHG